MRISSRWLWIVVPLALIAAIATVRGVFLQRDVRRELGDDVDGPLRVAVAQVDSWAQRQLDRATLAAALIGADLDGEGAVRLASPDSLLRARFHGVARIASEGSNAVAVWLLDGKGRVVATHSRDSLSTLGRPPSAGNAPSADRPAPHMLTHRCGEDHCVEVHAPILARGTVAGALVMRVALDDATFPRFAATRRTETGRTSLLARLGDSVVILATASRDTTPLATRAFAADSLPAHVQAAFAGRARGGAATPGLTVERSIHASALIPATGWVILREMQGDELVGWILLPAASEIALVAAIFLFGFGYLRSRLRIADLRREREATQVRADFLAGASHELRTPLAKIRMFAELVRTGSLGRPGESERALRIIEKEASRLSIIADNILSYVRLRRTEAAPAAAASYIATEIARDVEQVVSEFALLAGERRMRVVSAVEDNPYALVDSQALRQILLNFLDNAMKYGRDGQTVTVGARAAGGRVQVWVDDEGPGVPAAEREAIWSVFHRGEAATRSGNPGSGIGLAVVRDLVQRRGGSASIETAPGGGARFLAEFQRAVPPADPPAPSGDGSSERTRSSTPGTPRETASHAVPDHRQ